LVITFSKFISYKHALFFLCTSVV